MNLRLGEMPTTLADYAQETKKVAKKKTADEWLKQKTRGAARRPPLCSPAWRGKKFSASLRSVPFREQMEIDWKALGVLWISYINVLEPNQNAPERGVVPLELSGSFGMGGAESTNAPAQSARRR